MYVTVGLKLETILIMLKDCRIDVAQSASLRLILYKSDRTPKTNLTDFQVTAPPL